MRILFVAMGRSPHTAGWLNLIADQGWDLHLFSSMDNGVLHPTLRNLTFHHSFYVSPPDDPPWLARGVVQRGVRVPVLPLINRWLPPRRQAAAWRKTAQVLRKGYRINQLTRLIQRLQPDLIHALEFQHAGYMTLAARERLLQQPGGHFPPWIITNWGHDIYLYGRLAEHRPRIQQILAACAYYDVECTRDLDLGRELGLRGQSWAVTLNNGGYDVQALQGFRSPAPPSQRRLIVLKGVQNVYGRALFALRALVMCRDLLQGYRVAILSADEPVATAAEVLASTHGLALEVIPPSPQEDIWRLLGQARVYIGNNLTDGASLSSLEAMLLGAFPVQSRGACTEDWLTDGQTGLRTEPEDPHSIAAALRRALTDDALVDQAAALNLAHGQAHFDRAHLRPIVVAQYQQALENSQQATRTV
ncbi:MAG: glycosyltransferase family 4 protein [Anaerolineae bacterium]|nr:glycosyltransferase family 4 protein [Anaerolineae bacterium]